MNTPATVEDANVQIPHELTIASAPMDRTHLTARDVHQQIQLIQEIMQAEMMPEVHYGQSFPGAKKNTLYKAGAEKLGLCFRLVPKFDIHEERLDGEYAVMVTTNLYTISGLFVGQGIGRCSTLEEKYAWERAKTPSHYDNTPSDRRRIKYFMDNGIESEERQVRANVADRENTVLKMGKKRSFVDGIITTTAASDVFDQDLDEDSVRDMVTGEQRPAKKKAEPKAAKRPPSPNMPFGNSKGKAVNDPSVPLDDLHAMVRSKRAKLENPGRDKKWDVSDQSFIDIAEAEIAARLAAMPQDTTKGPEAPPAPTSSAPASSPATAPAAPREPVREPEPTERPASAADAYWNTFVQAAGQEYPDLFIVTKDEFKINRSNELPTEKRAAFMDAFYAKVPKRTS